jgi:hypothetical protein
LFIVGYDTAVRILNPKYYEHSLDRMRDFLEFVERRSCGFIVLGRAIEQRFHAAEELFADTKDSVLIRRLFTPLGGFREDLTSTELRAQGLTFGKIT